MSFNFSSTDFHGNWDRQTGHVSPLYFVPGDKWDYFNSNFTSKYPQAKVKMPHGVSETQAQRAVE